MKKKTTPRKLSDLRPAGYNPRKISRKAFEGLQTSIHEFGDLSGITFNVRTGNLVTGHKRVQGIVDRYGDLKIKDDRIELPTGESFKIRLVNWDLNKEKLANMSANIRTIQGEFTDGAENLARELLAGEQKRIAEILGMDSLVTERPSEDPIYPIVAELSEKYDLFIVFSKNEVDTAYLKTKLGIRKERSYKATEVGESHVVDVDRFRERWEGKES